MIDTPLFGPSFHFTTLVNTSLLPIETSHNYTSLQFTTLSFGLNAFKFPTTPFHLISLHFTSFHFTALLDDFCHTSIPFTSFTGGKSNEHFFLAGLSRCSDLLCKPSVSV